MWPVKSRSVVLGAVDRKQLRYHCDSSNVDVVVGRAAADAVAASRQLLGGAAAAAVLLDAERPAAGPADASRCETL